MHTLCAVQLQRASLKGRQQALGPVHSETLASAAALASTLRQLGEFEEAELLQRRVVDTYGDRLGTTHELYEQANTVLESICVQKSLNK